MLSKIWTIFERFLYFIICKMFHIEFSDKKWATFIQFVKFGLVGLSNNVVYYIVYLLLLKIDVQYVVANIIAFTVSVFNSFYWNNKYVFKSDEKRVWWKTFIKTYISYAGTGIVLSNALLLIWVELLGISKVIAPIINLVITIPLNYVINKLWAFKK